MIELLAGGCARLELSLAQRRNDIDQTFRSITYYDGTPRRSTQRQFGRIQGQDIDRRPHRADPFAQRVLRFFGSVPAG